MFCVTTGGIAAPENPLFPIASNNGRSLSDLHRSLARLAASYPILARHAGTVLRVARAGLLRAFNQVFWFYQPHGRLARSAPLIFN